MSDLEREYHLKLVSPEAVQEDFRVSLARDFKCPAEVLKTIVYREVSPRVVEAAATNPNANDRLIAKAIERFPEIDSQFFWEQRRQRKQIKDRIDEILKLEAQTNSVALNDRDQIIKEHIIKKDNLGHAESHLGVPETTEKLDFKNRNIEWAATNKARIAFVIAPSWGILFPPYNLAKLTGLLREHEYSVKVYDVNIESYHHLLRVHNQDYWAGNKFFLWGTQENFEKFLLPDLQELFDKTIDDIIAGKPKVVGFSCYTTNWYATLYMIKRLKTLMPEVCIMLGGPEATIEGNVKTAPVNYIFVGEAEGNLLHVLENLPDNYLDYPDVKIIGDRSSKLNLDKFTYPDYSDYNLSYYLNANGISIETSRGCVAQCSFCAETYFWKFRSLTPERVIEEMKYQINKHNIRRFWFVDSLVNGNLKNFERLVDLIIENKLNISWNSYARCDGRMTKEFLKKVAESGCSCLSYGVESGSQKVLDDMRKKIEVWEIENNLKDSVSAGVYTHVNWIWGFPTELPIDCLHSLQLIYNCRNYIDNISPGFGAGPATGSHMVTAFATYKMMGKHNPFDDAFLGTWYTENYENTIVARFIRIKIAHIWLYQLKVHTAALINDSQAYPELEKMYTFKITERKVVDYVPYDDYVDFSLFTGSDLSAIIANEYLPFLYASYRYFGAFEFSMDCDPEEDLRVFGDTLARNYASKITFKIDADGNYDLHLDHCLNHNDGKYPGETAIKDLSFKQVYTSKGNINDWVSDTRQVKDTVHVQYQNKRKKIAKDSNV